MEIVGVGVDVYGDGFKSSTPTSEEDNTDLRRGPWTVDEDLILINYIATHGEGRWNSLARCAGLKRTGKSCRLRWLNYLRPDVRRGNITPEEQLLILELHSRWGNRWSKIAQHMPGRTDNEIKNYWRTRVQKHAKQLKCDVNSKQFKDVMRYLWMPRLMERIRAAKNSGSTAAEAYAHVGGEQTTVTGCVFGQVNPSPDSSSMSTGQASSSMTSLDSSVGTHISSPITVTTDEDKGSDWCQLGEFDGNWPELLPSPSGYGNVNGVGLPEFDWWSSGDFSENLWSMEDNWLFQQQQL